MTSKTPGGESRPAPSGARELDDYELALRARVLDELAAVRGRIDLAKHLDGASAKEQLRLAHSAQRTARLADAAEWLVANEPRLLGYFADGREIDPGRIDPVVAPVRTPLEADLFRYATLQWSVPVSSGYGRRTRFLVTDRQNGKLIAIFALGDPVIAQGARDNAIGWDKEARNKRLYNVYDAFVLGAVDPYRDLLAGKLAALLTLSNEVRDELTRKYRGTTTGIGQVVKDPTPVLITTSSALGRSSVYNRVTFEGRLMLHSVGFTKGYGHFQFSDSLFLELREYVRQRVLADPKAKVGSSKYGSGPNWRFRVIRTALKSLSIDDDSLKHNIRREVFLAPAADGWDAYLRGESKSVEPYDLPADRIGAYYRERWAVPRAERKPGFQFWSPEEAALTRLLPTRQLTIGGFTGPTHGRVDLGAFSLSVGTGRRVVRGRTSAGKPSTGTAYMSRLEGPRGMSIAIADIDWESGDRELQGWDRGNSELAFEDVVGRLAVGVHKAERFRAMNYCELRPAAAAADGRLAALKSSADELSATVGFDAATAMNELAETTIGTREMILKDAGRRRGQLCAVFPSNDRVAPAVLWALTRAIPLELLLSPDGPRPSAPKLVRPAPPDEQLDLEDPPV